MSKIYFEKRAQPNDAGFNTFLKGFNDYVEGDIKIEDLFSVDFLFKGKLDNCVVTNIIHI